jgi:predicted metalloprotease with PDZ domain
MFEVRCTVALPAPGGQRFRLPAWIPGSYLIRDFARQFVDVRAEAAGRAVAIVKEAKDLWRAAPTHGPLTVIARVYAYDVSVRTAYVDRTRAYFNGSSVFMLPEGHEGTRCVVDIAAPQASWAADWRVATTLARDGALPHGFGRYQAQDYDELIDHPVEAGDFALVSFSAGGTQHEIAVTGRPDADFERLSRDLARVCQWHIDLFDDRRPARAPFDRYLFQITAVADGYGGLEHRSSTSLICRRDELPTPGRAAISDGYVNLLGLASHEYFHSWNVKRIKPAAFVPYDLGREAYTRQLWAFEGMTSYYDDLALVRSGVIDQARYLELVGRAISNVLRTPGRHVQSIGDSSFDAWIKFYRQDENSPNAIVSYYAKGAIVALALDLTLRSAGHASLDDVMRELWKRHGSAGVGVPEDGIEAVVSELAATDMKPFFNQYVDGTDDPPLEPLLARFGIRLNLRATAGNGDRGGKPSTGPSPTCWIGAKVGRDMTLQHVLSGSPAERAGLAPRDALIAIDGMRASSESLASLLAERNPGDQIRVHAFRRDALLEADVVLAPPPLDTCYLALTDDIPAEAAALKARWLGPDPL